MIKLQGRLPNGSGYQLVTEEDQVVTSLQRVLVDCGRFTERTIPILKECLEQIDLHGEAVDSQDVGSQAVVSDSAVKMAKPPLLERGQPGRRMRSQEPGMGNK